MRLGRYGLVGSFDGLGRSLDSFREPPRPIAVDPIRKSLDEPGTLVFETTSTNPVSKGKKTVYSWSGKCEQARDAIERREVINNAVRVSKSDMDLKAYFNGEEVTALVRECLGDLEAGVLKLSHLPSIEDTLPKKKPRSPQRTHDAPYHYSSIFGRAY